MRKHERPPIRRNPPSSNRLKITMKTAVTKGEHRLWRFFTSAINILQTLVVAIGAGLAVWGVINLLEGYGNDNPGANAHVR